jgi:hypothetical protein
MRKITVKVKGEPKLQSFEAGPGQELTLQITTAGDFFIKEQLNVLFHRPVSEIRNAYVVTNAGKIIVYKRERSK